jgi:hypothetical protein
MKKISLTLIGLYLLFLHGFSQVSEHYTNIFQAKPLKLEEINLVTSYYSQTGTHSAVTGGGTLVMGNQVLNGSEQLTDFANLLELKLVGYSETGLKHTLLAGLGVDHHTAASQKWISKTGASSPEGTRVYPSINWTQENEKKGTEFGFGAYYSHEYNYNSFALDGHYGFKNKTGGEFTGKVSAYLDQVKLIYPSELIPANATTELSPYVNVIKTNASSGKGGVINNPTTGYDDKNNIPSSPRNTYTGSLTYSQVINKSAQFSLLLDIVKQDGWLGLPFHRVFFNNGTEKVENLPHARLKIPVGARFNYFIGDNIIVRSYYRFYTDDWGLVSHTASIELPYKINPFFSISPFYRYYTQTATKYFAALGKHTSTETFYTSNYSSSAFSSNYFGLGLRSAPPGGLANTYLSALEIRYGHYAQTTDLNSNIISLHFTLK